MGYSGSYREPVKHLIVGNEHDGQNAIFGGSCGSAACARQGKMESAPPKFQIVTIVLVPNDEVLDGFPVTS